MHFKSYFPKLQYFFLGFCTKLQFLNPRICTELQYLGSFGKAAPQDLLPEEAEEDLPNRFCYAGESDDPVGQEMEIHMAGRTHRSVPVR